MPRIISIVPSQTELLAELGLNDEVVGITKFCVHPDNWFRTKTRVGGTKQLNIERIRDLTPDLILANKEENVKEQVEALQEFTEVWVSDVNTLTGAYEMIATVGELVDRKDKALEVIRQIKSAFHELDTYDTRKRVMYLIWRDPYMTVGGDTFISDMLDKAGYENAMRENTRYPTITLEEIAAINPDLIFLSSEPFPFREKHRDELQNQLPGIKTVLVDGEFFSWYGSRLAKAPAYFNELSKSTHRSE